jgi:hypothetical protein
MAQCPFTFHTCILASLTISLFVFLPIIRHGLFGLSISILTRLAALTLEDWVSWCNKQHTSEQL